MEINHSGSAWHAEEIQQLVAIKLFVFLNQRGASGVQARYFLKLWDRSDF